MRDPNCPYCFDGPDICGAWNPHTLLYCTRKAGHGAQAHVACSIECREATWFTIEVEEADLATLASRTLGDAADGSPTGDLAAALAEIEELRRAEMLRRKNACVGPWVAAPGYPDTYGPMACETHGVNCPHPMVQRSFWTEILRLRDDLTGARAEIERLRTVLGEDRKNGPATPT